MEVHRRLPPSSSAAAARARKTTPATPATRVQALDALPLPIRHTNLLFSAIFAASLVFLMRRWREKVRLSAPLHVVGLPEIAAIVASLIYLISFFGIAFVQSIISSNKEEDEFLISPASAVPASSTSPVAAPCLLHCPTRGELGARYDWKES